MAYIVSYSHITTANIPKESWDEAWLSLMSWKGYLQSFPGLLSMRMAARALENGDIRFHSATIWEYPEQLEEWRESSLSAEALLSSFRHPAYDIEEETFEDFA